MVFQAVLGEDIPQGLRVNTRRAVRAVIFRDGKLLMVKTNRGDYKFPGGGSKDGETDEETLKRETAEETGYEGCTTKLLLGQVCEQDRDSFDEEAFFKMTSLYYLAALDSERQGSQLLDDYENEQEFAAEWVTAAYAMENNEKLLNSGVLINDWVRRETHVLKELLQKMTHVYFVRHAEPCHDWVDDATRPLTDEGLLDSSRVTEVLREIPLDRAACSPYKRSKDTIRECAEVHGLEIEVDDRLRERISGRGKNTRELIAKRWDDFTWHEEGGESLKMVQLRNLEALNEVLSSSIGKNVLLGTHGTALSVILNYYDPRYDGICFFRMIDFMPYIIRLDFLETGCVGGEEILIVEKPPRFLDQKK